jgi:hypothetical protein
LGLNVDPFMPHIYAACAEQERRNVSERTRQALATAKARGQVLGNAALAKANRDTAAGRAEALRDVFTELAGMTTRAAAAELERRGITTSTGAPWSAMAVLRIRNRLAAEPNFQCLVGGAAGGIAGPAIDGGNIVFGGGGGRLRGAGPRG